MTPFNTLHLLYIILIILALVAGPTPIGISGTAEVIIKTLSIVFMIMFFASAEFMSKKEKDFLEKYNYILKYQLYNIYMIILI